MNWAPLFNRGVLDEVGLGEWVSSSSTLRFSIQSDLKMRSPPLPLAKGPEHCTMFRSTRSASQVVVRWSVVAACICSCLVEDVGHGECFHVWSSNCVVGERFSVCPRLLSWWPGSAGRG